MTQKQIDKEESNMAVTPEAMGNAMKLTVKLVKKMAKTMFCGTPVLRAAERERESRNSMKEKC